MVKDVPRIVGKQFLEANDADLGLCKKDASFLIGAFAHADLHSSLQCAAFDNEVRLENEIHFNACFAGFTLLEGCWRWCDAGADCVAAFEAVLG